MAGADPDLALLDALFVHAPVGLGFWDRELRYRRINDALAAINGIPAARHLGRTPAELLGRLGTEAEALMRRVLSSEVPALEHAISGRLPAGSETERHFIVSYYPVVGAAQEVVGVAAAVAEVTAQHAAAEERTRLLKDALTARAHAEAAQIRAEMAQLDAEVARARTELLIAAEARMSASMDYETTLQAVAETAVPAVADWCVITLAEPPRGELRSVAVAHADPERMRWAQGALERYGPRLGDAFGPAKVVRTGEVQLVPEIRELDLRAAASGAEQLELLLELGLEAALVVPLRTADRMIGALTLCMSGSQRRFAPEDVGLAEALASRAAQHIRNAQLYTERSHIAHTLQASLLPHALPDIPGLEVAARYQAAGDQNEVGGDFYDVYPGEDGDWWVLIGDVTGKGPEAAASTSLARHTLRSGAVHDPSPAANLRLLNRAMLADTRSTRFATVVCARVRLEAGGAQITLSVGGHPPPLLLCADGHLEALELRGTLVGGLPDPVFVDTELRLDPGDLLLLYTDGVTELRTKDPSYGERRLRETTAAQVGRPVGEVLDAVLAAAIDVDGRRPRDDVALLALRVSP